MPTHDQTRPTGAATTDTPATASHAAEPRATEGSGAATVAATPPTRPRRPLPTIASARAYASRVLPQEVELLKTLARIPSPSGHEEARARFVIEWLLAAGASRVKVDDAKNAICLVGDPDAPRLVAFSAHTDIVAPDLSRLPMHEDKNRLFAPGVGDDTANLVGLLMATRFLLANQELLPTGTAVLVVANSCEEGLGNLRGTRALYEEYGERICEHHSFDLYLPQVITHAVGSHRYRITCTTQGGHSLRDFGRTNAIEVLCQVVEGLYALEPPEGVTYNVGTIKGGSTVNSIAANATMTVEYRAQSQASLLRLHDRLMHIVHEAERPDARIDVELIGDRPCDSGVDQEKLAVIESEAAEVVEAVTGEKPDLTPASTDANIPLSLKVPAVNVGAVRGGLLHTRDEWVSEASLVDGLTVILGIMLKALARYR